MLAALDLEQGEGRACAPGNRPMRRIIVMNSKGGCGKTTIATNLASYYAAQGRRTALFDYDSQHSSSHWLRMRPEERPGIHGVGAYERQVPGVTRSWQLRVPPETERVVIDTPASMDRSELTERIRNIDTILIPVLPSPIDTYAAADFVRDLLLVGKLRRQSTRVGIIPNRVRVNTRSFHALNRFLEQLEIPAVAELRDTQAYVAATDKGLGIHELDGRQAQRERRSWRHIIDWLEDAPEASY